MQYINLASHEAGSNFTAEMIVFLFYILIHKPDVSRKQTGRPIRDG